MIAYAFDPKTGHYAGQVRMQIDPMESKAKGEDVYLMPANATLEPPPQDLLNDQVAAWNGEQWHKLVIETPILPPDIDLDQEPDSNKYDARIAARSRLENSMRPQTIEELTDRLLDTMTLLGIETAWTQTSESELEP